MTLRRFRRRAALAAVLALGACSLDTSPNVSPPIDPQQDTWATSLGVNFSAMTRTANGVYYQDTQPGTGRTAMVTDSVAFYYSGYLPNGSRFDSNVGSTPLVLRLGKNQLIPGFEEGLIGTKAGGKRRIIVPSQLGYGASGVRDRAGFLLIPPNTNLLFEVELVSAVP